MISNDFSNRKSFKAQLNLIEKCFGSLFFGFFFKYESNFKLKKKAIVCVRAFENRETVKKFERSFARRRLLSFARFHSRSKKVDAKVYE